MTLLFNGCAINEVYSCNVIKMYNVQQILVYIQLIVCIK